ncbi:MAG: tetratricopeptide repeat protein [Nitrospirae bacterium]|nr:tetratricopeptide repeat protein [Nitrospirota bacterium]
MKRLKALIVAFIFAVILPEITDASKPIHRPDVPKEAEIVSAIGDGWVRFVREKEWIDAIKEQILISGDFIKTGDYGRMSILFIDDIQIKVHKKTTLMIKEVGKPPGKKGTLLRLEIGEVWSRARSVPEGLRIETPSATAAIRGTDWDMVVDEKGTSYLTVLRGIVELFNEYGTVLVGRGEQAMAEIGRPPVKLFLISPKERVQWVTSYTIDVVELIPFYSHRRDKVLKILPSVKERVEKDPADLKSMLLLAGLLFDLREWDESQRLFDKVLKSDPRNGRALTFRGFLALDKGDVEKATYYFVEAIKNLREEEKTEPLLGMVGVHLNRNEIEKASKLLDDISKKDISPTVGVVLAVFNAFQGNFTKAINICSGYGSRYPDDERFPTLMANFYLIMDEAEKAKEAIDRALKINPEYSGAYTISGRYYYLEGRAKEAEDAYKEAIKLDPKNAVARNDTGIILLERGYYEESIKELSEAIEITPRGSVFWSNRGHAFNRVEDLKSAGENYRKATELDPVNYLALNGLGLTALKEGRTEEAIQYFLKSSLLEPTFAEPHTLLAVAYYQLGDITRALEEIRLAVSLDPKDPFPHIIAYLIYPDIYRPFDSIKEAKRVLGLLPYLKSMDPIENTRQGLSNLGSVLLGLGMSEWAESYAQESFDPHDPSSHFFASRQYANNLFVTTSEITQGILLDPLSISGPTRYQDIIRRPRHNSTLSTTIGDEDGGLSQLYSTTLQGYLRKPFENAYYLSLQAYDNDGFRENGYSKGNKLLYGIGLKPDYKNGLSLSGWLLKGKGGAPGSVTNPDPDDRSESSESYLSLGYRHRFGLKNNLLARFAYVKTEDEFISYIPLIKTETEIPHFQARHLFDISENHQVTYGLEYIPSRVRTESAFISPTESREDRKFFFTYINDRWRVSKGLLIDSGIFYESYRDNNNDYNGIHPRLGLEAKLGDTHIFRIGLQRWLQSDIYGTLAPVATAGIVVDNSLALTGSRLTDYQARFESRWSDRFFTAIGAERVELKDANLGEGFISRRGYTNSLTAAINTVMTDTIGVFLRYRYTESKNTDDLYEGKDLPLIPEHFINGGIVWVSPLYIKAILSTSYVGERFGDLANTQKMSDYWTTDFSAQWEPFMKRLNLSLAIRNIFDKYYETLPGYPVAGRSAYVTMEYRF